MRRIEVPGPSLFLIPAAVAAVVAALADLGGASPAQILGCAFAGGGIAAFAISTADGRRRRRRAQALADGIESLRAGDFSVRLAAADGGALGDLASIYNDLADALATERGLLRRRELLLDGALEASPAAVLLVGSDERILFANRAARVLFHGGRRLEGHALAELCADGPEPLRQALASREDALVTVLLSGGEETFQVHQRGFELDTFRRRLVLVRRLTAELRRQEVAGWKKAIRVIGHEVRSHLAAMLSLARSARQFGDRGDWARAAELLEDVDQAGGALQRFIDGYGRFARLPEPRRELVELRSFLGHLERLEPFRLEGEVPAVAVSFDPGQIQQVLMNLLKNAREAGSVAEEIRIAARAEGTDLILEVRDRGCGMDGEALARSLLPLQSTKPDGGGLGLALCREIVEAHGGWMRLEPRRDGGLLVSVRLPVISGSPREADGAATAS